MTILEHATGWLSKEPLYRNRYVADTNPVLGALVDRGLMVCSTPQGLFGGMRVYVVTPNGLLALRRLGRPRRAR